MNMNKSEKLKDAKRRRERLATENLADSYIRKLHRASTLRYGVKISSADIPPEIIEIKRELVQVHRIRREFSKLSSCPPPVFLPGWGSHPASPRTPTRPPMAQGGLLRGRRGGAMQLADSAFQDFRFLAFRVYAAILQGSP